MTTIKTNKTIGFEKFEEITGIGIQQVSDSTGVYKIVTKAGDYPSTIPVPQPFSKGDTLILQDTTPVEIGDRHKKYPAKVAQIFYEPRKWWQFRKKKKQLGYMLQWE